MDTTISTGLPIAGFRLEECTAVPCSLEKIDESSANGLMSKCTECGQHSPTPADLALHHWSWPECRNKYPAEPGGECPNECQKFLYEIEWRINMYNSWPRETSRSEDLEEVKRYLKEKFGVVVSDGVIETILNLVYQL